MRNPTLVVGGTSCNFFFFSGSVNLIVSMMNLHIGMRGVLLQF